MQGHKGAVKALAWNPHKLNMLVTGGGSKDQSIKLWDTNKGTLLNTVDTGS